MAEFPTSRDNEKDHLKKITQNTAEAVGQSTSSTVVVTSTLPAINVNIAAITATLDPKTSRVDDSTFAGETLVGKAAPGASDASAVWQIQRFDASGSGRFAGGNANYDKIWNNRGALSYP